jgi:hypothetical protein
MNDRHPQPLYHCNNNSEFLSCRAAEENRGEQRISCIFVVDIYHVQEHWN